MKLKMVRSFFVFSLVLIVPMISCGKKEEKKAAGISVSSLSSIPEIDSMVSTKGFSLTTGTPPYVKDITESNIASYMTGSVSTLLSQIETARASRNWDSVRTLVGNFYDGNAKCQVIEQASKILTNLRNDTSALCMIRSLGKETGLLRVASGTEIEDGKWFNPMETDVVRQFGVSGSGVRHVFQIQGTSTEANVYQFKVTSCDASNRALRSTLLRVDNNSRLMTVQVGNKATDEYDTSRLSYFELVGTLKAEGDSYVPDTSAARTIFASRKGTFTYGSATNAFSENGRLTVNGDTLTAVAIMRHAASGTANAFTNIMRGALSVQFSGSSTSDLAILQGAGKNRAVMTGSYNGNTISQDRTQSIGFDYNDTTSPKYETVTTGTYVDIINAIDFSTDSILSLSQPADPAVTVVDDAVCRSTPSSVIMPAQGSAARMAQISADCNKNHIGDNQTRMCEALRQGEMQVQYAISDRRTTGGKTDGLGLK